MTQAVAQRSGFRRGLAKDLKGAILAHLDRNSSIWVWTADDFIDLGSRSAVDKALQRLSISGDIRRISRGLYDVPRIDEVTGNEVEIDYTCVLEAVARREKARLLPDGATAAKQLGLVNAIASTITIHTDARLRSIQLGQVRIDFKPTAPRRLYWAGRPAMRVVQSLRWVRTMPPTSAEPILQGIKILLLDPDQGPALRADLEEGLHFLPAWMRNLIGALLGDIRDRQLVLFPAELRRRGVEREISVRNRVLRIAN
jgi:hypothetical protein